MWRRTTVNRPIVAIFIGCIFIDWSCGGMELQAERPLHQLVDELIERDVVGPLATLVDDSHFLRRIYLDLHGTIPAASHVRAFLKDESPDKRQRLLAQLLADPQFSRHMAATFDVMLMERRADKHVKNAEWHRYLQKSFAENKPYDQLAREILGADGSPGELRAAAKFYLERDGETNLLTREVARIFFGKDLQCAQCHDHPLVDDFLQAHYYGISAFLNRSFIFQPDKKKPAVLAEKAEGDVTFKSVFTGESGQTRPRLPGDTEIDEPSFKKGEEYQVKPAKNVRPIPKYSRRSELAKRATDGSNQAFNRNIANRLWSHMMKRGLVTPVDLHHTDNPAAHPELLELLANQFVAMQYDIRKFLSELAQTRAYQRSIDTPADLDATIALVEKRLPKLKTELDQLTQSLAQVDENAKQQLALAAKTGKELQELKDEKTKAASALAATQKKQQEVATAVGQAQTEMDQRKTVATSVSVATQQIKATCEHLENHEDLLSALKTFQERDEQLQGEVKSLAATFTKQTESLKGVERELALAKQTADASHGKAQAAEKEFDAVRARLKTFRRLQSSGKQTRGHRERKLATGEQLMSYSRQIDTLAAVRANQQQAHARRLETDKELQAKDAQLATLLQEQKQIAVELASIRQAMEQSAQDLEQRRSVEKSVQDALAATRSAAESLPQEPKLAEAVDLLNSRASQLTSEVKALQSSSATRRRDLDRQVERNAQLQTATDTARARLREQQQVVAEVRNEEAVATKQRQDLIAGAESTRADLGEAWNQQFAVASIRAKTPEQMAWSAMQATGFLDQQRKAIEAALDKKTPLSDEDKKHEQKLQARRDQVEQMVVDKLKGNLAAFIGIFGAGAGQPQQEFFATVDQALFFANGNLLRQWLNPSQGNLTHRLSSLKDPTEMADEIYLSVLTRRPSDKEVAEIVEYLTLRKDDVLAAQQEIISALVTSTEFRFNH